MSVSLILLVLLVCLRFFVAWLVWRLLWVSVVLLLLLVVVVFGVWSASVVESVSWRLDDRLHGLAVQALKKTPDRDILSVLGIGIPPGESGVWTRSPNSTTAGVAEDALKKWKLASLAAKSEKPLETAKAARLLLWRFKAKSFLEAVDALEVWVRCVDTFRSSEGCM